jgi:hypothetical protein
VEFFCVDGDPPPHARVAIKTVNKKTNDDMRRKTRISTPFSLIVQAKRLGSVLSWFQFKQAHFLPQAKVEK